MARGAAPFMFLRTACADARVRMGGAGEPQPMDDWIAFGGAALFAMHPLMSEAVGYISGRSELLCGVFFVSTLLIARAAIARGGAHGWPPVSRRSSRCCRRRSRLALPVVLLAYDWLLFPGEPVDPSPPAWLLFVPASFCLPWWLSPIIGRGRSFVGRNSTAEPVDAIDCHLAIPGVVFRAGRVSRSCMACTW